MDWMFNELRKSPQDPEEVILERFYAVTKQHIHKVGADGLLRFHKNSFASATIEAFPNHKWVLWRFDEKKHDRSFWRKIGKAFTAKIRDNEKFSTLEANVASDVVEDYMKYLASKHNIQELAQWNSLSFKSLGSADIRRLKLLGGRWTLLAKLYPDYPWVSRRPLPSHHLRSSEKGLSHTVDDLIPLPST